MNTPKTLMLTLALTAALTACGGGQTPAPATETPAATAPAAANGTEIEPISGTYVIDPTHTDVLAQWNHLGFSNPSAHFGKVEGTIVYDADDVGNSSVSVTIPLSALNSFTDAFDAHLHNADFFETETYPTATFASTAVESTGTNTLKVSGDLTIKDITRPVELDVRLNGAGPHPRSERPAIGFDATTSLLRSDFGLGLGAPAVSDEVLVRITVEAAVAAE